MSANPLKAMGRWRAGEGVVEITAPVMAVGAGWAIAYAYLSRPAVGRGATWIELAILLGASFATLGAGAMSLAIFTDSDASDGTWTSGTIILNVTPATSFNVDDIMPGDSGSQTIAVANTGTGALRYAMTSTADNTDGKGLRAQLGLTIQAGTCTAPGATLYSGTLNGAALGDVSQGAQAGDRNVASGGTDNLCFSWSFPLVGNLRGYAEVFKGYGESLIDYNHNATYADLGISLLEWY